MLTNLSSWWMTSWWGAFLLGIVAGYLSLIVVAFFVYAVFGKDEDDFYASRTDGPAQ